MDILRLGGRRDVGSSSRFNRRERILVVIVCLMPPLIAELPVQLAALAGLNSWVLSECPQSRESSPCPRVLGMPRYCVLQAKFPASLVLPVPSYTATCG